MAKEKKADEIAEVLPPAVKEDVVVKKEKSDLEIKVEKIEKFLKSFGFVATK